MEDYLDQCEENGSMSTLSESTEHPNRLVVEKAAEWYIRCTSDELTRKEHTELREWVLASEVHMTELLRTSRLDALLLWHYDPARARTRVDNERWSLRRAFELAGIEIASARHSSKANRQSRRHAARPTVDQMKTAGVFGAIILAVVLGVVRSPQDIEKYPALRFPALAQRPATTNVRWTDASIVIPAENTSDGVIIVSDPVQFTGIVRAIELNPRLIHDLSWRQWEEIVAAAWERFGYRVQLTPRSGDGGRDVIATSTAGVAIRIFDQVKFRAMHRVVTADEVRSMLGTLCVYQNVSKAFVTTTSDFAPGVYESPLIQQFVPFRLELRSRMPLVSWLSRARDAWLAKEERGDRNRLSL